MTQDELDRIEARVQAWRTAHQIDSVECMAASADDVPALVAEVKRLRGLVREAYSEGWHDQFSERAGAYHATAIGKAAVTDMESEGWDESDARKALEGA